MDRQNLQLLNENNKYTPNIKLYQRFTYSFTLRGKKKTLDFFAYFPATTTSKKISFQLLYRIKRLISIAIPPSHNRKKRKNENRDNTRNDGKNPTISPRLSQVLMQLMSQEHTWLRFLETAAIGIFSSASFAGVHSSELLKQIIGKEET